MVEPQSGLGMRLIRINRCLSLNVLHNKALQRCLGRGQVMRDSVESVRGAPAGVLWILSYVLVLMMISLEVLLRRPQTPEAFTAYTR